MYFWNIDALNKDLKKGISQKEDFKYLLAYIIMGSLIYFIPTDINLFDIIDSFLYMIFSIVFLYVFYNTNGGENGKNLLSRYFSIGFVAFVRSLIYFLIPLMLVFGVLVAIVYGDNIPDETTFLTVLFSATYLVCYFHLCINYLKALVK